MVMELKEDDIVWIMEDGKLVFIKVIGGWNKFFKMRYI